MAADEAFLISADYADYADFVWGVDTTGGRRNATRGRGLTSLTAYIRSVIKLADANLDGAFTDLQQALELAQTDRVRFYGQIYLWIAGGAC